MALLYYYYRHMSSVFYSLFYKKKRIVVSRYTPYGYVVRGGRPALPLSRPILTIPVGPENVEDCSEPAKAQHPHHYVENPHYFASLILRQVVLSQNSQPLSTNFFMALRWATVESFIRLNSSPLRNVFMCHLPKFLVLVAD